MCGQYPTFLPTLKPTTPTPSFAPTLPPTPSPTISPTTFDTTRLLVSLVLKSKSASETTKAVVVPCFSGLLGGANVTEQNVIQNYVSLFQGGVGTGGNVIVSFAVVESFSKLGYQGAGEFEVS